MKTRIFKSLVIHTKNSFLLSVHAILIFELIASGCGGKSKNKKAPLSSSLRRDLNAQKEKELKERCAKPEFANEEQCIKLNTSIGGDCRLISDEEVAALTDKDTITKQQIASLRMCNAIGVELATDGSIVNPSSETSLNVGAIVSAASSSTTRENVDVQLADKKIRKTERYTQTFKRDKVAVTSPYIETLNELANRGESKPADAKDEKKDEKKDDKADAKASAPTKNYYTLDLAFQLALPKDKVDINSITVRFGSAADAVINVSESITKKENKFLLTAQASAAGDQLILRVIDPSLFIKLPYELTVQFLVVGGQVMEAPGTPAAEGNPAQEDSDRQAAPADEQPAGNRGNTPRDQEDRESQRASDNDEAPASEDSDEGSEVRTRTNS